MLFHLEWPRRPLAEQVLPYGLASMMRVTPAGWSMTETSREVRLARGPGLAQRTDGAL